MKTSWNRSITATLFLLTLTLTPCFAQDGDRGNRGNRRQGGFGQGGFGGGMMGGGMMGGGMMRGDMMLLGLLRIEEVQKEIDLMPDQQEAITKLGEKLRETRRPEAGFDFREATEAQRNEFMEKMRAFGEEQSKVVTEQLEEVLFPEQLERLRQIGLQQQGPQAFSDPSFIEKIGLTKEQQDKVRAKQEEMIAKLGEMMREAREGGDREAMGTKLKEMRDKNFEEAKGILTADQKKKYDEMLGKPFDMPEDAMRGGFGGAGGGRGGDRGPGGRGPGGDRGGRGPGGDRGNDA